MTLLRDQADALNAQEWAQIDSQNSFFDVALTSDEHSQIVQESGGVGFWGVTGPRSTIDAWNSGAYDPVENRMFFMGGGHANYGGNEVYQYDFDTLTWSRLSDPDPLTVPDGTGSSGETVYIPEDGPLSPHAYDGLVWNPVSETLWLTNTGIGFASDLGTHYGPKDSQVWEFDPGTGEWTGYDSSYNFSRGTSTFVEGSGQVLALDNSKGGGFKARVIESDNGVVNEFGGGGVHPGRKEGSLLTNPDTGQVYQVRKEGITRIDTVTDDSGNIIDLDTATIEGAPEWFQDAGIDYNPNDGMFYMWKGGRDVVRWDPGDEEDPSDDTFETLHNVLGDAPSGPGRVYDKFVYLDEVDAFAAIQTAKGEDGGFWLYKPGDNPDNIDQLDVQVTDATLDAPTNHAINIFVPAGELDTNDNGSIEVQYRETGASTWQESRDLHRQNSDDFSGSVLGLDPDTEYEIRLTPADPDGVDPNVPTEHVLTATTSALPTAPSADAQETRVASVQELRSAVAAADAGDVIVLEAGVHHGSLDIKTSGLADAPITIRGADSGDSVIDAQGAGQGIRLEADHVRIEGLTVRNADKGIALRDGRGDHVDGAVITGNTITNVRRGIDANEGHKDLTIVDNLLIGNNAFGNTSSETWGDEGIVVTGQGIQVAHNTVAGFGDSLGLNKNTDLDNRGIEIHHNQVLWGGDDGVELDFADRNVQAHHNLLMNTANGVSFQFVDDGPATAYRNVIFNAERGPYKIKPESSTNEGVRLFNNTSIKSGEAWRDFSGSPESTQVLNNLFVSDGSTDNTVQASTTNFRNSTLDFNAWSHDGNFQVGNVGSFGSFRDWRDNASQGDNDVLLQGERIFQALTNDTVMRGFDSFRSQPADGFALDQDSSAVDAGTEIAGITDGFTGIAPDIGAVELGDAVPDYGSRVITNLDPIVRPDGFSLAQIKPVTIDVLANDLSLAGGLKLTDVSGTTSGTTTLTSDGRIKFTPNDDFQGDVSFNYTVTEDDGDTATGVVSGSVIDEPLATYSNASLVLRSDALANSLSNGDGVSQWSDRALDNDASQGEAGRRPTLVEDDGVSALRFDGVDDVLRVANSDSLNVGGPYEAKTLSIAFRPGDDVDGRQVIYEQGGAARGINLYLENGEIHASAWNTEEDSWGPITLSGAVNSGSAHTLTLSLDANAGTLSAYLDGTSLGTLDGANTLHDHGDEIAFGALNGDSYFSDGAVETNGHDFHFGGEILDAAFYNGVLSDAERSAVEQGLSAEVSSLPEADPNGAPTATADAATTVEDTAVSVDVVANDTDPDGDSLSVTEVAGAGSGSVVANGDGTVTYTPDSGFSGDDSFDYTVSDGNGGTATGTVSVGVEAAPSSGGLIDPTGAALVLQAETLSERLTSGDGVSQWTDRALDNDASQGEAGRRPTLVEDDGVSALRFDGVDDVLRVANSDSLNVGGPYEAKTLSIAFRPGDDVDGRQVIYEQGGGIRGINVYLENGQVHASAWNTNEGAWGPVTLSADVTPGEAHTITLGMDAASGTFSTHLDGQSLGTRDGVGQLHDHIGPIAFGAMARDSLFTDGAVSVDGTDFHFGGEILDAAFYNGVLSDAERSAVEQGLSAEVSSLPEADPNGAPTATADAATTVEDTAVSVDVVANDTDPDGDSLSVTEVAGAGSGSVVANGDGTVTYTPDSGFSGDDSFDYTVSDGNGGTATGTVSVGVEAAPSSGGLIDPTGAALVLQAETLSERLTSGDGVSQWTDRALDNDASQGEAGRRPTLVEDDGVSALRFDGVDDVLEVANSEALNTADQATAKTLSVAFRPGDDIDSRQVVYEQGGGVRGLNIYLEDGEVHVSAWNRAENEWGPITLTGAVNPGQVHTVTLALDSDNGTVSGYLDDETIGTETGASVLHRHWDPVAFGAMSEKSRFEDGAASANGTDFHFGGEILDAAFYNAVAPNLSSDSVDLFM